MTVTRTARRLGLTLAGVAAGAAVARAVRRRRPALAPVAADLRSPVLYLPLELRTGRLLPLINSLPVPGVGIVPGVEVESRRIPNGDGGELRVVTYQRAHRPATSAALLWMHGGGMVMGAPEQAHGPCSRWVDELGLVIVSVDYRLAPDRPFPVPLEDCYTALGWLHDNADVLGIDRARVAVGGDSAGGGLAAALSQLARDRSGPAICFQLLQWPMLDDRTVLRADHGGRGAFIWTPASNRVGWTAYLGHPPRTGDAPPYAAPARTEDLSGLPPAWVGVGDLDLFLEEDVEYARRLQAADVACELHVEPGMYHLADRLAAKAATARNFRRRMTGALAAALTVDATVA